MEQSNFQKSDSFTNGQGQIDILTKSFNHKHNSMSVIIKKAEKISTAIYMVTDFVPDSEPMRHELRVLSLSLIKWTRKIGQKSTEPDYTAIDDLRSEIEHILVLVRLSSTVGIVSEMNAKIITTELEKVQKEIESLYGSPRTHTVTHPGYKNVVLKSEMFEISTHENSLLENPYKGQQILKGQSEFNNVLYKKIENKGVSFVGQRTFNRADQMVKNTRRDDIMGVIRNKGRATIKDVASFLPTVGEKTIQRELLSMVKDGLIKKEGEKRWSTYSESIENM